MKKLLLQVDDLRIDSFETHAGPEERGTVRGADAATSFGEPTCIVCTRANCGVPSEMGYATFVNGHCIRC